jgi:N-acetylglucosamine-6-phosphate deacetylase
MQRRIETLVHALVTRPTVGQVVVGLHLEGPFISPLPGFVGAHPREAVIPADLPVCQRLCAAGQGHVRLVTLAPEADPDGRVIRFLEAQQIVVAAGHTDASLVELQRAIDWGLRGFTHLGNGCPVQLPRHDNIIHRVLSLAEQLKISLIADGRHVPGFVLRQYLDLIPDRNIVIVSDSISAAGLGPGRYPLGGQDIEVDAAGVAWAANRQQMAGSTGVLSHMAAWLRDDLGYPADRVETWCWRNPANLIGVT